MTDAEALERIDELKKHWERTKPILLLSYIRDYGPYQEECVAFFNRENITEDEVRKAVMDGVEEYNPLIAAMTKKQAVNVFGIAEV